jgi:sRNA-binding regulator protein Hfq
LIFLEKNKIEVKIFLLKVELEKDAVVIYLVNGFGKLMHGRIV